MELSDFKVMKLEEGDTLLIQAKAILNQDTMAHFQEFALAAERKLGLKILCVDASCDVSVLRKGVG